MTYQELSNLVWNIADDVLRGLDEDLITQIHIVFLW